VTEHSTVDAKIDYMNDRTRRGHYRLVNEGERDGVRLISFVKGINHVRQRRSLPAIVKVPSESLGWIHLVKIASLKSGRRDHNGREGVHSDLAHHRRCAHGAYSSECPREKIQPDCMTPRVLLQPRGCHLA
jgi:hypothetical protein